MARAAETGRWSPEEEQEGNQSSMAMTSTATERDWRPAPMLTPVSGLTSEKSRPHATVMCWSEGRRLLVGSASIQPAASPHQMETHAWEASAPWSFGLPGGGMVSR